MVYTWEALKKHTLQAGISNFIFLGSHPIGRRAYHGSMSEPVVKCSFTADGTVYSCAEQFMMAEKARMFGDRDMLGTLWRLGSQKP